MKKLTKILGLIIPMLILSTNCYAMEEIAIEMDGWIKYAGIATAIAIIALIIYLGYKNDKKAEDKEAADDTNYYLYDEASVSEEGSILDEEEILGTELAEGIEYEEESLFNTANNYIEKTETSSFLDEEDDILDEKVEEGVSLSESNDEIDNFNSLEEGELSFETESQTNKTELETNEDESETEDFSFDTTQEDFSINEISPVTPIEEDKNFENSIQENSNVKRFTRKKQIDNKETIIDENNSLLEEDEFDEYDDTPTFDELLKKSEEEIEEDNGELETFDFMAEMEENLKKNQAKRLQKKTTKKSITNADESTKKQTTKRKKKSDEE